DLIHREQYRALLQIDVVADGPIHTRQWRIGPIPLARGLAGDSEHPGISAAVALRLVKPADRVVAVGDVEHVVRRPTVIKTMRPNAGHAAFGHLLDLVIGERLPFINDYGIEPGVVRPRAGRGVKVRL